MPEHANPRTYTITHHQNGVAYNAARYLNRMVSPLCGIDKGLAFSLQDGASTRIHIALAHLTAVHRLLNLDTPFSYHIGGYGIYVEETLMRALGESLERYSHMTYPVDRSRQFEYGTVKEMTARYGQVLQTEDMVFFQHKQFERTGFPFKPCSDDTVLGWIETIDVATGAPWWVPAQFLIVGYVPRHDLGEPWITSAVTTGSAAHTRPAQAMCSALLEVVQADTTMGYWYSDQSAHEILLDERTPAMRQVLQRDAPRHSIDIRFYYLKNPDIQIHVVAAVIWNKRQEIPACGIGMAAELNLELAMYKAYLEACAIPGLAIMATAAMATSIATARYKLDPSSMYDLDNNVMYYGYPENREVIETRFLSSNPVNASELPPDRTGTPEHQFGLLLHEFLRTGKRIAILDLTSPDVHDLDFCVFRFYSPDTLGLCLPSAPQLAHRRYAAYGGARHERPHPYP